MSDDLDLELTQRLRGLAGELSTQAWAEPDAVRARGRQLARRAVVSTSLAVVLVIGLGVGGAWRAFGTASAPGPAGPNPTASAPSDLPTSATVTPSPPPSTAVTPSTVEVADAQVIQAGDLGPEWGVKRNGGVIGPTESRMQLCQPPLSAPSLTSMQGTLTVIWTTAPVESSPRQAGETLMSFSSGAAVEYIAGWKQLVAACPMTSNENASTYFSIVDEGFAGDESIMMKLEVRTSAGVTFADYLAMVRRGDWVAAVTGSQVGVNDPSALTYQFVEVAVAKMCAGGAC